MSYSVRQVVRRLVPRRWKPAFDAAAALAFDYGHLRSGATGTSIDAAAAPIPWYTYPAIEFLRQLDFAQADVFEYDAGFLRECSHVLKALRVKEENIVGSFLDRLEEKLDIHGEPDRTLEGLDQRLSFLLEGVKHEES